ncbi:hypothetical protein L3Q82_017116 [Scortum barcoo]|uniref:Uncharacterized protein n=1 Tax=Scortum barcoo TaxID=214431 RepID=A0ACB8X986_9TELE|nr:hypothetical protein L3Q82_017116 [Scortum barcoo]
MVTGQTKSGSQAHHEKKNIKDRYVARIGVTGVPPWSQAWGWGSQAKRLVAGSLPTGPGRAQPEMATWARLPVGSPPTGSSLRGLQAPAERRKLDRPGRPKRIVRVCWERLAEPSVREVFNSHLRKSFSQIPREAGDIESEWTMFSASIVDAVTVRSLVVDARRSPIGPCLACGTPDAVDRYWQAKQAAAQDGPGGKNSGLGGVRAGGELLTSTEGHCRTVEEILWKKYFEDLLNPTDLPSSEEAEAGDSEVDSSITQAEVTEVVRKLLGGKAPGVDEIRPEYLKSLDVVGLSWLTRLCLCNIAWRLGTVPLEWQTGVVVPLFKKGDRRVCSNYRGITLLSLPGKVYARVLERRIRPIVDPRIQEEQCGFRPGRGTLDQLYTLRRVLGGFMGVCPTSPHVLCGSGEGIRPCPSWYSVGSAPRVWGPGPLLRAVRSLYDRSRSLVRIAGRFLGVARGRRESGLGTTGFHLCFLRMMLSCWLHQARTFSMCWRRFAAECEAAGMRISTSKSEAMASRPEKGGMCPLQVGGEVLPQVEEFKYLGVLFTKSIYVPTLTYGHELWVMTEKDKIMRIQVAAEMSFLRRVAGRSLRDRVRSSVTREELGVEPLLLLQHREESAEVAWASISDAPWTPP